MTCAQTKPTFPHVFTEGDQLPEIIGVLSETNLTNYVIEFGLERPNDTVLEKSTETSGVVILDAANGKFKVTWEKSPTPDLIAGQGQCAQIRFIDTAGRPMTSRDFLIDVKEYKGS